MPEEITTANDTQAESAAPSQEDTTPLDADAQPHDGESQEESLSLDEVKKLRSEARNLRIRLKTAEQSLREREDAEMSELDKLKRALEERDTELNQYRTEARQRAAQDAVTQAASGAIKPEAIWRMVRTDVEYDEEGNATNVADLVAAIKADMPELFRSPNGSADGGAGGKAGSGHDINSLIRGLAREAR